METSDSDYFESADEDFRSDDETQIEKEIDAKSATVSKVVRNTEKLSISDDLICNKGDTAIGGTILKTEEKIHERCYEKSEKDDNIQDSSSTCKTADPVQDIETRSLPEKTECWEPGMNYDDTEKSKNLEEESEQPEFGSVPAKDIIDHSDTTSKFQIPPAVSSSECLNLKGDENKPNSSSSVVNIQESVGNNEVTKEKPKRPEFGIPPARPTCWVPGVTNTQNTNASFEPHPAYLELMKKRQQNTEEDPKRPEFGIPPARTTCRVPSVTNTKNINQLSESVKPDPALLMKENMQENMWDNDDWGDFDNTTGNTTKEDKQKIKKPTDSKKKKLDDDHKEEQENMWEDDDWEPIEPKLHDQNSEKPAVTQHTEEVPSTWGGWGNWGLSSVLSTATTLTSQVSQGISNVLETGIGAPGPEELARMNKLEKEKVKHIISNDEVQEKPSLSFGLGNLVQGVTKLVETTSTKVISGGLDTLETIGKKTMEVLQENDPGLKKKRAFLKLDDDRPILSQLLREAKEKAEKENRELEKKHFARKANYETLFDDHQGLVHLEALEMLSKQCDIKLQNLLESTSGDTLNEMQETIDQVKELCELPEEDEDETLTRDEIKEKLELAVKEININITYKRLLATLEEVEDWLSKVNLKICSKNELHQQAIESLAQLTAIAVEQFHKAGELLLVKDHRSTADEADSLVQLTTTLTALIGAVAAKFSEKLNMIEAEGSNKEEVNSLITNVFFEAANSSSYIQDAFQLLMPVLQVGAL